MLTKPVNVDCTEWPTSTAWFDEDGIFCSVSKKAERPSLDATKMAVEKLMQQLGGKKICMLVDITNTPEAPREIKDYVARELPKFIKAMAMVSGSALGKMMGNLFFTVKAQPFPTKVFTNADDAKAWLKQYL